LVPYALHPFEVEPAPGRHVTIVVVHLRAPSIDPGVKAFIWAFLLSLYIWAGLLAVGMDGGTALILALLSFGGIFLFVRLRGYDAPA
jgi:hypothetical protein